MTSPPKYLQKDNLSEECKKLLSFLPKEKGWVGPYIYNYQGFWLPPNFLQRVISFQQQFQAQDSDIILVTIPKSGTTWLKSLLFALVNRVKHPIFESNHPLLVKNPHVLVPFLEHTLYIDGPVPNFLTFTSPRLLATHVPFTSLPKAVQDSKTKLVYLCRNPRDTFISMWHFANNLIVHQEDTKSIEEMFDLFCEGASLYGPFWNHVLDYWKQSIENPQKVIFLMYEEIKKKPKIELKRLAEFLECPFSIEEENSGVVDDILKMCSFENLRNLEVNSNGKLPTGEEYKIFFRRGEVGDWKNYFTIEMSDKLNHIIEEKLQGSGLNFLYV
ncbi:cytosolic sulfotransferase 12-like [Solanum pennellii]|uniref:Sulfotransferase n=1 Tax=Solanum pennellii TaxID=28526 RepID=A0ABM1FQL0_SOLPN|nr:cytosolic sulfotransferase 12-like [Solanum pennellii]